MGRCRMPSPIDKPAAARIQLRTPGTPGASRCTIASTAANSSPDRTVAIAIERGSRASCTGLMYQPRAPRMSSRAARRWRRWATGHGTCRDTPDRAANAITRPRPTRSVQRYGDSASLSADSGQKYPDSRTRAAGAKRITASPAERSLGTVNTRSPLTNTGDLAVGHAGQQRREGVDGRACHHTGAGDRAAVHRHSSRHARNRGAHAGASRSSVAPPTLTPAQW